MDIYSTEKRSQIMSRVKGKNSHLEMQVFRYLKSRKIYFRRHYMRAPGKPDIALPSKKIAVFVDSDFWHGWHFSEWNHKLAPFWRKKIANNIKRDKKNIRILRGDGWKVMRVWEHSFRKNEKGVLRRIETFLSSD